MIDIIDLVKRLLVYISLFVVSCTNIVLTTPFRLIYDFYSIKHPDFFRPKNTPLIHSQKVKKIQEQIKAWNKKGRRTRMVTSRPSWQTISIRDLDKSKYTQIKVDLEDIIEIDEKKRTIRLEPGLKMGTLTHKILRLGWIIPVVPEFETLTVGGLINGAGLETSSHKYGLFADTCLEYELVLSDGSHVTCSRNENPDLFYAIPMSYGTLGLMTAVTIPIIPAGKYVKMEHVVARSMKEAEKLLRDSSHEFVEGITFDRNNSVISYGDFVDNAPADKINHINAWYKTWYYKHIESFLKKSSRTVEYFPTRDFYHRHQKPLFWMTKSLPFTDNNIFPRILGFIFPINTQIIKLTVPRSLINVILEYQIIQDFVVPIEKLDETIEIAHKEVELYPIWLCPTKLFAQPGLVHPRGDKDELYIDIGIYGEVRKKITSIRDVTKKFEKFSIKMGGFQGMYADCYLTKDEFTKMFSLELYDKMRAKLGCEDAYPHVFDKITIAAKQ